MEIVVKFLTSMIFLLDTPFPIITLFFLSIMVLLSEIGHNIYDLKISGLLLMHFNLMFLNHWHHHHIVWYDSLNKIHVLVSFQRDPHVFNASGRQSMSYT